MVREILKHGLDLPGVTFAMVFGLSPEGGSTYAGHSTRGFHELRHGESFLEILRTGFDSPDLDCLDEPEALSSSAQKAAPAGMLHVLAQAAPTPSKSATGARESTYEELQLAANLRERARRSYALSAPRLGLVGDDLGPPDQRVQTAAPPAER